MIGQVFGILRYATEPSGPPGMQPGQAKKIQTKLGGDAALVYRVAVAVEYACFHVTKVRREADAPDDTGYTCGTQVQVFALGLWLPYRLVWSAGGSVDGIFLNIFVDAAIDSFVHRIGRLQFAGLVARSATGEVVFNSDSNTAVALDCASRWAYLNRIGGDGEYFERWQLTKGAPSADGYCRAIQNQTYRRYNGETARVCMSNAKGTPMRIIVGGRSGLPYHVPIFWIKPAKPVEYW
jgi:hypothetical protein